MKYSTVKQVKNFCDSLFSTPDYREVIAEIEHSSVDFEVNNVRFIKDSDILEIMAGEIFSDLYCLGCFNVGFIAENTDLNYELVKACQDAGAFEAIGKAMDKTMDQDDKEAFCEAYAMADGYGHHFNSYDFGCEEITIDGELYHVFDQR